MIIAVPITRDDQIQAVATAAGITAQQARAALDAVASVVVAGLTDHDYVTIQGLGRFVIQHRRPRRVRNPSTGMIMDLPASVGVKFRPAAYLREQVERAHT
jgi:DNA-binding protein HU-beta